MKRSRRRQFFSRLPTPVPRWRLLTQFRTGAYAAGVHTMQAVGEREDGRILRSNVIRRQFIDRAAADMLQKEAPDRPKPDAGERAEDDWRRRLDESRYDEE